MAIAQAKEIGPTEAAYRDLYNAAAVALAMKHQHGPDSREYRKAKLNVTALREVYVELLKSEGSGQRAAL